MRRIPIFLVLAICVVLGGCMHSLLSTNEGSSFTTMEVSSGGIDQVILLLLDIEIPKVAVGGVDAKLKSALKKLEHAKVFLADGKIEEAEEKLIGAMDQLLGGAIPQIDQLRCGGKNGRCIPDDEADILIAQFGEVCLLIDDILWPPPVAIAKAAPLSGDAPLSVLFDGSSSFDEDGAIVSYEWSLGDEGVASGMEIPHTYTEPGEYTAVLVVTDDRGKTADAECHISVGDPSELLFKDDFESYSIGTLPIGPAETWCYLDYYAMPEPGWPKIESEGGEKGQFMHIYSPWGNSRQHPGTIIEIPGLESGESLELCFDLRLNAETSYIVLELVDRYFHERGAVGCVTQDPKAPVWQLEGFVFYNGYPGDPTYPYRGLLAVVMGEENPTSPGGPRKFSLCPAEILVGEWYSYRMVHTSGLLELFMNETKIGEVVNDAYDLSQEHDWMLTFGDANSNSPGWCDVSIDNLVLQIVRD